MMLDDGYDDHYDIKSGNSANREQEAGDGVFGF